MMLAGDVHQADDLVADVFVLLLKRWEHVENPHTWMKAVISRRVIKAGRPTGEIRPGSGSCGQQIVMALLTRCCWPSAGRTPPACCNS